MKWSKKIALMTPVISAICLFGAVNAMQSSYRQPGATPSGATPFDWCETSEGRSVREMAVNLGLSECVNILGPRSRKETIRRIRQADLLLLLAERFVIQIPGKTYEYLRAGRPILALTSEGALANFLLRTGAGWVVNPKDDAGVLGAVRERYRQWEAGERGPVADPEIVAGFDRRKLAGRLAELFDHLNGAPRSRHSGSSNGK